MLRGIDLRRLLNGSVVEPQDNVPIIIKVRSSNGDRLVSVVREDRKRAGSVKADTTDGRGINIVLCQSSLDCGADTAPDVIRRLLLNNGVSKTAMKSTM